MWAVARWPVTGSPPRMRGKGGRVVGRPLDDRITPRMRGKATPGVPTFTVPRITPAYAGKSWQGCYHQGHHEDHPRICGEKAVSVTLYNGSMGSPPHMRGKAHHHGIYYGLERITPAYAGKSSEEATDAVWFQDHPRICGEKFASFLNPLRRQGSPPHMRGKVSPQAQFLLPIGITPAYAGKSFSRCCRGLCLRDHPRICGEKACRSCAPGAA